MKKVAFFSIFIIVVIPSCRKILDKKPLDLITDASVWEDQTLVDAFLTTQYSFTTTMVLESGSYINDWGTPSPVDGVYDLTNSEHFAGPFFINQMADESMEAWNISPTAVFKAGGININRRILEYWEYPYYVIRNLNSIIERLPNTNFDQEYIKKRVAEAKFLRAFNYFYMVKRYGGVPIILNVQQTTDLKEELFPSRNTEQEVYDFIISELNAIENDLSTDPSQIGRPSKWAALALKSRAALYAGSISQFGTVQLNSTLGIPANLSQGYYQIAYDAANKIIQSSNFSLFSKYADKVKNFRSLFIEKKHSEVIFAKQHDFSNTLYDGGGNSWSYDFFQMPKPHGWDLGMAQTPYLGLVEAFEQFDGTPGKLDKSLIESKLWSMDELWGNKDPRFFATVYTMGTPWKGTIIDFHHGLILPDASILQNQNDAYNGVKAWGTQNVFNSFFTGFGVMKYLDESIPVGGEFDNSGTDFIVFRYGEILLNLAEAAFELGKPGEATDAINQIRDRAGIAPITSIDRDVIRHERRVELAFEGHRYWDLRRWRIATTELSKPNQGIRYYLDYQTKKYKVEILDDVDGTNLKPMFYDYNYYLPITLRRTGVNPNLIENPGY